MVSAFVKAYPNLPGYHMWSTWDRLIAVSTFGPVGSEEEDDPDSGWDFSALNDPGAMRGFMSACDHCLSGCSDDGHDLDDEGYGPSRECFHVDQGDHNKGNHLGMPEVDDPPGPASRVDIPRELAVVLVPAGGQDIQLEQICEMQARVNGEAGRLVHLRQNIEQEWAGRTLTGEACHRAQDIRRHIVDNARTALPPTVSGSSQDLAAAAMLLQAMPEPSTTEGRRIQGELKNLLEGATVRRAESSASRRRADPSEHHAVSSRRIREASVHPERTRDEAPAARECLGNEHHHLDHRALLDEKVRRGYHPRRGRYPLVVDPIIGNVRLSKVLMDGGSSLNIIYAETLELLGVDRSEVRAGAAPFHGIAPGKRILPLGRIDLPVCFGTPSNFRKEALTFEVVGFRGTYHVVLGRPCYAKFMAVPNYTYLKLKMSGPNGIITVGFTYRHAYECDVECVEYAKALAESEALIADLERLSKEAPDAKQHAGNFEPVEAVKSVSLSTPATTPARKFGSASSLTPNRKQCSSTFFVQTPKSLRGVPRTCPAYRGMSPSTHWTSELEPDP
jgi:hypothetical protein